MVSDHPQIADLAGRARGHLSPIPSRTSLGDKNGKGEEKVWQEKMGNKVVFY